MGEIPERSIFHHVVLRNALEPYAEIVKGGLSNKGNNIVKLMVM